MLIGGDDISNQNITLGTCFSMFVYIRARFLFPLIDRNLKAQSTGSHRGTGGGIQIPERQLQAVLPFPAPPPERPESFLAARPVRTYHRPPSLQVRLKFIEKPLCRGVCKRIER